MSAPSFEVSLADYSDLSLEVPPVQKVTQELVMSRLVDLQYQLAGVREVKRPVRNEDRVLLDLYALADDVVIPGSAQSNLRTLVREDMLVPGFSRQLLGMVTGQKKDFQLTLPENTELSSFAGQSVVFRVQVKQIFELNLPEVEELPQRSGKAANMPELLEVIAKELQAEFEADWKRFVTQTLIEAVVAASSVQLPPDLIVTEIANTWNSSEGEILRQLGLPAPALQASLAAWQASPELQAKAAETLKTTLVLHTLAGQEGLGVSTDELAVVLQPFSESFQQPLEVIYEGLLANQQLESLILQLEVEKAASFLFDKARLIFEGELVTA